MRRRKDTQSAWFDIAVFAAVASFFLFSARSLTRSQARMGASTEAIAAVTDRSLAGAVTDTSRTPASEDHAVATFRLDCLFRPNPPALDTEASLVRIVAELCEPKPIANNMPFVAKNKSSGEDIVPFVQNGKIMSTNYFSLKEGTNLISFELNLGKQKIRRQELQLVRHKNN